VGRKRIAAVVAGVVVVGGIATMTVMALDDDEQTPATTDDVGGEPVNAPRARMVLECPRGALSAAIDDFTPKAYETPTAAVDYYVDHADGENVVFTNHADGRLAWILRADGTARAWFVIVYRTDIGGWSADYFKSCNDEPLAGKLDRPH
jgi:hypothetical protein